MRSLKTSLESHPIYLILVLSVVLITTLFLIIDVHDHFQWNLI